MAIIFWFYSSMMSSLLASSISLLIFLSWWRSLSFSASIYWYSATSSLILSFSSVRESMSSFCFTSISSSRSLICALCLRVNVYCCCYSESTRRAHWELNLFLRIWVAQTTSSLSSWCSLPILRIAKWSLSTLASSFRLISWSCFAFWVRNSWLLFWERSYP